MSLMLLPNEIERFSYTEVGIIERAITANQKGRVKFLATSWFAQWADPNIQLPLSPGELVNIVGRRGTTLLITPIND